MKPVLYEIDRINKVTEGNCMAIVDWAVGRLHERPRQTEGNGIVMVAGGPWYSREAYVTLRLLRNKGCQLPIQVWHLGPLEIHPKARPAFESLGVELIDAYEQRKLYPMRRLKGWEAKSYAVKHCGFKNVLLLDSDSHPVILPEKLFRTDEYLETGCVLFPDIKKNRPHDRIFPCLGLKVGSVDEHEAGQLLIDRERHWKAVLLTCWMNGLSDFFYKMMHGDKDTWGLAFARLGIPYSQAPAASWEGWGILHRWLDGSPAFEHHMERKRNPNTVIPSSHRMIFEEFDRSTGLRSGVQNGESRTGGWQVWHPAGGRSEIRPDAVLSP